jgi:hypothetical protein
LKSSIKQKVEYKKKSISHTRNMCNSIKRKEFELFKSDILPNQIFCDNCNCHLSQNNTCYYDVLKLCVYCYNSYYLYDDDYYMCDNDYLYYDEVHHVQYYFDDFEYDDFELDDFHDRAELWEHRFHITD